MRLWIENVAPDTADEELKALLVKYAPDLVCESIVRVGGEGVQPGALLRMAGGTIFALEKLTMRLNGMYWKQRSLTCRRLGTFEV